MTTSPKPASLIHGRTLLGWCAYTALAGVVLVYFAFAARSGYVAGKRDALANAAAAQR